jgi:hypothetical protein
MMGIMKIINCIDIVYFSFHQNSDHVNYLYWLEYPDWLVFVCQPGIEPRQQGLWLLSVAQPNRTLGTTQNTKGMI